MQLCTSRPNREEQKNEAIVRTEISEDNIKYQKNIGYTETEVGNSNQTTNDDQPLLKKLFEKFNNVFN